MESAKACESPGQYLKATRESQKRSLKEVADATRIREPVLKALEEDRDLNLPTFYIRSFLSTYAGCLGLNPDEVITGHQRCEGKPSFAKGQAHPLSAIRTKRAKVRLWVISISVALVIALIAYLSFELPG